VCCTNSIHYWSDWSTVDILVVLIAKLICQYHFPVGSIFIMHLLLAKWTLIAHWRRTKFNRKTRYINKHIAYCSQHYTMATLILSSILIFFFIMVLGAATEIQRCVERRFKKVNRGIFRNIGWKLPCAIHFKVFILGPVVQSEVKANRGLNFNQVFQFVYFCTSVYLETSKRKTLIDPD
jgi:hypothetical protein